MSITVKGCTSINELFIRPISSSHSIVTPTTVQTLTPPIDNLFKILLQCTSGTIYFTIDGSDPVDPSRGFKLTDNMHPLLLSYTNSATIKVVGTGTLQVCWGY